MNLKELNFLNPKTRRKIAAGAISVAMGFSIVAPNIATVANVAGIQVSTVKAFADEVSQQGIKKTVSGDDAMFFVLNDDSVMVLGSNKYGQIGIGDTTYTNTAIKLGLSDVETVTSKYYATYFVTKDGSIYVCGKNDYGQLGTGDTKNVSTPVKIGLSGVKDVFTNGYSTFFTMKDGSTYACGLNAKGQLGIGDTTNRTTPVEINIRNVKNVVLSSSFPNYRLVPSTSVFFQTEDGSVYVCGCNNDGQLGIGDKVDKSIPVKLDMTGIKDIISTRDGSYSYFTMQDGTVMQTSATSSPVKLDINNVKKLVYSNIVYKTSSNQGFTYDLVVNSRIYAILNDGSVYAIGFGGLGTGDGKSKSIFTKINLSNVKDVISCDIYSDTFFLTEDGTVYKLVGDVPTEYVTGIKSLVPGYKVQDLYYQHNTSSGKIYYTAYSYIPYFVDNNGNIITENGNIPNEEKTSVSTLFSATSVIMNASTYTIDKIYNADDQSKYGSWFTGFYSKSLYDNNDLMQFILNNTDGTATLSNGGIIQDESQIKNKYFLSDGSMILVDNYGMVQYYKGLTTTSPSTLPIDGSGIIGADTLVFGTGTSAVKHPVLYFGSSSKYIDTDGSLKTFTLKNTDIKKMFAYKYAKGVSQYMLIQKSDGSLVYLDADGHQQDFGLNMNDVSYIMPATGVNKDIFVMKDGTLRDDQGVIVVPDGVTLSKIWSNRIFEMSDGFLYTFQNGTFKNTNTLDSFAKLAQNNALLLKNGNFQLADTSGNLTNDLDVSGNDVKYMSQLDSTNMYLILNDGTTYGVGDKVQGDSLENHGININDVSAFLSNGSDNVVRALVTKDGTVYTNPGSWAKNTLVHFSSDAVNSAHDTNPVYTNPGDAAGSGDPNKLPGGTDEKGNGINPIIAEDTTGPTINITGSPTDWTNGDVTLSYSASDEEGGSGFSKVVLPDNTEVTSTTGTFKVTENGTYMFKAVDNDGNETTQTVTVSKIDKIAPTVPSISNDNGTVTIAAGTDEDSGVKETDYSIDGGAYQKYGSAFTLEPGIHTVKAKDIDNAGNESSEVTQNVTVEDTAFENATQAVENAESTKSQGDVDTARDLVDALPESPEKQALEDRLDTVQDEIDQAKQDEQNLKDASDAVDHAEDTENQDDLDHAKDLVDNLPDGPGKDNLEDRIDDIQDEIDQNSQEAQDLADATAAVEKAEQTKTKGDYDTALSKVSALKDGADKTGLQGRLDNVKSDVDELIADADSKVTNAENSKTQEDIDTAQAAIDKVPDGWDVSDLQERLDNIKKEVGDQNLAAAEAAVEKAESTQLQEDVYSARVLVNKLPSSQDKTDLNRRLDAVQNIIDLYKNVEQRVQTAEKLKTQSSVSSARSLVSTLPAGDKKDSFNSRLDAVEAEIALSNTIKAIDRDITALEKDVDSHIKYNSNIDIDSYKNKVTALRDRVNALPDSVSGTKLAFNERLDTVDSKLTKQKGVQDAVSKVVDAIDKAGQTLDNKDIQDAQDAIDNLPDGVDRSQYQSELNTIKQKKQAKVAKDTTDANKAVTTASRTRLQSDIDAARVLVNALPDGNNKTQLSKQLDLIQKYVKK
ncbi:hypothetical protein LN736_14250 [Clostridium sp. WLY-B-L2]|uniref:Uncharacterized protein n=1 Tax=Clostridium aromativorans TaxID=2836848 RepID=A0ABS8N884_9CLOT|nr:hypothetical protein [Clostridium aromativorans]MCC9296020.1 hypothetical protein [Clostridium aromativorans]